MNDGAVHTSEAYTEEANGEADDARVPESEDSESDDDEPINRAVQEDMEKLQNAFPGFRDKYRLIKRIGEGSRRRQRSLSSSPSGAFEC